MTVNHRKQSSQNQGGRVEAHRGPNLQARYKRTLILACELEMIGDIVEAERLYQQADRYRRLLNNQAA